MMRSSKFLLFAGLVILLAALAVPGVAASDSTQAGYITVGIAPVAQFDAHYAFSIVPTQVSFTDSSLGSTPMTYQWDFGDGATSTDQNPSHPYTLGLLNCLPKLGGDLHPLPTLDRRPEWAL